MKKHYTAPEAQTMLLIPDETLASSWKDDNSSWKTPGFFWKQSAEISTPASGKTYWWDFGPDEINPT